MIKFTLNVLVTSLEKIECKNCNILWFDHVLWYTMLNIDKNFHRATLRGSMILFEK